MSFFQPHLQLHPVDEPGILGLTTGARLRLYQQAMEKKGITDETALHLGMIQYLVGPDPDAFVAYEAEKLFANMLFDTQNPLWEHFSWYPTGERNPIEKARKIRACIQDMPGVPAYMASIRDQIFEKLWAYRKQQDPKVKEPITLEELLAAMKADHNELFERQILDGDPEAFFANYILDSSLLDQRP